MNSWPQPGVSKPISLPFVPLAVPTNVQQDMNRKTILIVDDSAIILKTLSMLLKNSGYNVLTAADGAAAVSTVRRERPHLVLLDISFPPDVAHGGGVAWDGFLIMDWLRRIDEVKDIPVMIITGGDPGKLKDRSLAAGAVAFFQKPIDNGELLSAIRQTIGEAEAPVGGSAA
jgi:CheY-like chemotaxis protein